MFSPLSAPGKAAQKDGAENLNRACEPCRLLKVRCLPDPESKSGICQRCNKSGRSCVFTAPQKRRQRIRTDTRVAELEREVRSMRAILSRGGSPRPGRSQEDHKVTVCEDSGQRCTDNDGKSLSSSPPAELKQYDTSESGLSLLASQPTTPEEKSFWATGTTNHSGQGPKSSPRDAIDFVDRGLLSLDTAYELFETYVNDVVPLIPVVIFPSGYTASEARVEKPVLFAAVVTATSCQLDPSLFSNLFEEMNQVYAERIMVEGQKNLELIQAMLITSIWYCPPDVGEKKPLKFFQYIILAASMAVDIGLGSKIDGSSGSLEECRTLLACYISCSSVSMRMGRPNMLQWTSRMDDCLKTLELSPAASIHDSRFAAWVKHQNITDEYFESANGMDESRRHLMLKSFERRLESWKMSVSSAFTMDVFQGLICQQNSIFIYEAIFGGADPLDLNHLMFNVKASDTPPIVEVLQSQSVRLTEPLSTASISAITACIDLCQTSLDAFLALDIKTLQLAPILLYVRVSYAIVILIKLLVTSKDSSSELSKILDPRTLEIGTYIPAIIERVKQAAGPRKLRIPIKWLSILIQIKAFYHHHENSPDSGNAGSIIDFEHVYRTAIEATACLSGRDDRNLKPNTEKSDFLANMPLPSVLPTASEAMPQAMFPGPTPQDISLSMPVPNAFPMILGRGESHFSPYTASGITATDPNDWITESSGTLSLEPNWDPTTQDWSYNFK